MKRYTETIVNEGCIKINVTYETEIEPAYEAEPGNPNTTVPETRTTNIICLQQFIDDKLTYTVNKFTTRQEIELSKMLTYDQE